MAGKKFDEFEEAINLEDSDIFLMQPAQGVNRKVKWSAIKTMLGNIFAKKADIDGLIYYITPEMFGAHGDGVSDDTESIQKAVNFLENNPYLVLYIRKKYVVSETINIQKNNIIITGGFRFSKETEKENNLNDYNIKYIGDGELFNISVPCCKISGIVFVGNNENEAIKCSSIRNTIEECHFLDFKIAIKLEKKSEIWEGEHKIRGNIFSFCNKAIEVVLSENGAIQDSSISDNIISRCEYFIYAQSFIGYLVNENHDYSYKGSIITTCRGTKFLSNYFDNSGETSLTLYLSYGGTIIDSNTFLITEKGNMKNIKLIGNASSKIIISNNSVFWSENKEVEGSTFIDISGEYIVTAYLSCNSVKPLIENYVISSQDIRNIHGNEISGSIHGDLTYTHKNYYLQNDLVEFTLQCSGTINGGDVLGIIDIGGPIIAHTFNAMGSYVIDGITYTIPCTIYIQDNGTIQLSSNTTHVLNNVFSSGMYRFSY